MASLRFNYDAGGKRPGKPPGVPMMRSPLFPYPAGHMARNINNQPIRQLPRSEDPAKEPEPLKESAEIEETVQDIVLPVNQQDVQNPQDVNETQVNNKNKEIIEMQDIEKKQDIEEMQDTAEDKQKIKLNASEQLVAFLENSEVGLNNVRSQVTNIKVILEDFMVTLENFQRIMGIIYEQEQRRLNRPQATVAAQKESKDTIDQILELLQTPALQSILRQFMLGIVNKVKTT